VLRLLVVRLRLGLLIVRLGCLGSLIAGVRDVVVGLGDGSGEDASGKGEKGNSRQLHVGGLFLKKRELKKDCCLVKERGEVASKEWM
jgi:hypothetical protein